MTACLESYRQALVHVDALEKQLEDLREKSVGNITGNYSGDRIHTGYSRGLEDRVVRLLAAADAYCDAIGGLAAMRSDVQLELDRVPDDLTREVLANIYVENQTVMKTASILGYTYRHIEKLKKQGMDYLKQTAGK